MIYYVAPIAVAFIFAAEPEVVLDQIHQEAGVEGGQCFFFLHNKRTKQKKG